MTAKKHLKNYQKLASERGAEPLEYLFKRFRYHSAQNHHTQATALALQLIPYGHAKKGITLDKGEAISISVIKLE